jgi:hypothetical protein
VVGTAKGSKRRLLRGTAKRSKRRLPRGTVKRSKRRPLLESAQGNRRNSNVGAIRRRAN